MEAKMMLNTPLMMRNWMIGVLFCLEFRMIISLEFTERKIGIIVEFVAFTNSGGAMTKWWWFSLEGVQNHPNFRSARWRWGRDLGGPAGQIRWGRKIKNFQFLRLTY
jgi:hypothetical protein